MPDTLETRHWLLDAVAGWHEPTPAPRAGLAPRRPDGALSLVPLPAAAEPLLGAAAALGCPAAVDTDGCGGLVVVDAATALISKLAPAAGAVVPLPAIGGPGAAPRRLSQPRGVARVGAHRLVVADTGNHRVQLFALPTGSLLKVWGARDAAGAPRAGAGRGEFQWPWAVAADEGGVVYVVDRGNRRLQAVVDDAWEVFAEGGVLGDPTRIAVGPDGRLAVVDGDRVVLLRRGDRQVTPVAGVAHARSVAFAPDGRLYVGDATGLVYALAVDATAPAGYAVVGAGVTRLDGAVVDLAWEAASSRLVAIIHENQSQQQRLWWIDPEGGVGLSGTLVTGALDSGLVGCQWHRVVVDATVRRPRDDQDGGGAGPTPVASLEIESFASDTGAIGGAPPAAAAWKRCLLTTADHPDCVVQSGPGRYLWLRLTFRSNGIASHVVRSLKVSFPRVSYLDYLPAVYQEDEESRRFLERFLGIFQASFDAIDERIDALWQLFDPASTPAAHLSWLAGWVGLPLERRWTVDMLRRQIKTAVAAARRRGTVAGLEAAVRDYAGVGWARALEHFRLRRWPALGLAAPLDGTARLWSRSFYQRLQLGPYSQLGYFRLTGRPEPDLEALDWGAHQFTLFFPADPYRVDEMRDEVARVVEREKPAHTAATVCPVLPRMRVGVQATVGMDSVVGGLSHLVLNRLATLSYDSILACSAPEQGLRALGSAIRPQIGVTTKLS